MYVTKPKVISRKERNVIVLSYGHLYEMEPVDDSYGYKTMIIKRDGQHFASIYIDQGQPVDFCVSHDLIAVATIRPAGLYLCRTWRDSTAIYIRFPLERHESMATKSITLGNYGSNIIALWYGLDEENDGDGGPVNVGIVSGKDAFRFNTHPLCYYTASGQQKMFIRKSYEKVLAVPHFPGQMGAICKVSHEGIRFYSLRPYYTMESITDDLNSSPLFYNMGYTDPAYQALPDRVQFDAFTMNVQINGQHMVMKYDAADQIKPISKDWVKITVDGQVVGPNDLIYLTPLGADKAMRVEPLQTLSDVEISAELPVSLRLSGQDADRGLSQLGLRYLPRGQITDILMRPMQCITPFALARFMEKYNIAIRAEVWT